MLSLIILVSPSLLSFFSICSLSFCLFSSFSYREKETNPIQIDFFYVVGSDDYGLGRVLDNGESQFTKRDLKIYNHVFDIGLERRI